MTTNKPINIIKLKKMKEQSIPITVITAYDFPSAKLAEEAGVEVILVGDSLGNVILGYDSTVPVTLDDMIHHTKAVTRSAQISLVVADMPFLTYHGSLDTSLHNAARLMQEGRCKAVKMEGGQEIAQTVRAFVNSGIPVMGHIGFTPQSVYQMGGYRIQGRNSEQAEKLMEDAIALEQAGAFAVVLEMVTAELASFITKRISIPTIGIGAGRGCDGQVLVFHDVLAYETDAVSKKFVKHYAAIGEQIKQGIAQYVLEVKDRSFPDESHSFRSDDEVVEFIYGSKPVKEQM